MGGQTQGVDAVPDNMMPGRPDQPRIHVLRATAAQHLRVAVLNDGQLPRRKYQTDGRVIEVVLLLPRADPLNLADQLVLQVTDNQSPRRVCYNEAVLSRGGRQGDTRNYGRSRARNSGTPSRCTT